MFPIYDWTDKDVWMYIRDNNLEFPDAYKFMYQVGTPINRLRISQFFSIDTIRSLVNMCEFYPGLFDKICKREPNAYMAMLYFDTEMFRRQKKNKQAKKDEEVDYKNKLFEMLKEKWRFDNKSMQYVKKRINRILIKYGPFLNQKHYKELCNIVIGGDPKGRTLRALDLKLFMDVAKESSI